MRRASRKVEAALSQVRTVVADTANRRPLISPTIR
jgi:hypothetical protein